MRVERVDPLRPSPALVEETAALLGRGGVAAFPTDTVYGLGCSGLNRGGLARLRALKGAGRRSPFILLVRDSSWVSKLARRVTPLSEELMRKYWPGPLSIVFDASEDIPEEVTLGGGTVAIRNPDCGLCISLCRELGGPVASTSANVSGQVTAGDAAEIVRVFGDGLDLVIDGGPPRTTEPSTLVDARGKMAVLLRQGTLSLDEAPPGQEKESGGRSGSS